MLLLLYSQTCDCFGGIFVGGFGRARVVGAMADEPAMTDDPVAPAPLENKSTRQLVRERAQAERAEKDEKAARKAAKKEAAKKKAEEEKPKGEGGIAGLKNALSRANWGVRMAKAFAPSVNLNARNRVKVGVRIRPMNEAEKRRGDVLGNDYLIPEYDTAQVTLKNPRPPPGQEVKTDHFAFDHLYGPDHNTEQVFKDLALPLVHLLVEGYNGTIFAYGQTGSGKTHSIMGSGSDPGVVPRTCEGLFKVIGAMKPHAEHGLPTVTASYLQIYRETLHDLLSTASLDMATSTGRDHAKDLKIRRGSDGIYVENLTCVPLDNSTKLTQLIDEGNKKRATSATLMNAASSRSHAVVIISVDGHLNPAGKKAPRTFHSKLSLVDLAGSERVQKSGATGASGRVTVRVHWIRACPKPPAIISRRS